MKPAYSRAAFLGAAFFIAAPFAGPAANPSGAGPQAATEGLKRFATDPALEVSLIASEPAVRNPTDMDIDERGRAWITEGVNYRVWQKWGVLQPEGDRIVIVDPATTGSAKEKVFYQDPSINAALGICVLGNRVIVSDSPNVYVLTDTDGDGIADKRELLFTGIGGKDHDHGVHAFVFGPDGKLYFNMGNEGKQLFYPLHRELPLHGVVGTVEMKPVTDLDGHEVNNRGTPYRNGMVFRCNLDGTELETLAWNFRNNYEVAIDSFGTLWQSDNDDDGNRGVRINYVMEFGNYGYADEMTGASWGTGWSKAKAKGAAEETKIYYEWHQYDPGVVPDLLHTGGGSPTGLLVYEGNLLPPVFQGELIHCDAGPRVVRSYRTEPHGAGYTAQITNILWTEDAWFRPSDVCAAPDGSIFVVDWNDAGVGGHYMADQKLETMTGRLYRIAPKGRAGSAPKLDLGSAAGCVAALCSPNQATRYLAWTRLHEMQKAAEKDLSRLWHGDNPRFRARALQLLARIKGREKMYLDQATRDPNPDIRITALRIARSLRFEPLSYVKALSRDKAPQVRRECAIALRHQSSAEAAKLWAELASQYPAGDRWYLEALGIGADGNWDACLESWLGMVGDGWNSPTGRDIVWRSRARKTPGLLAKIISSKTVAGAERDHYFRAMDFQSGPEKDAALLELLTLK